MRLKRLCEAKGGGKLQVDPSVHAQWMEGCRDELAYALTKAIKEFGTENSRTVREQVRAGCCPKNICLIQRF